MQANTTGRATPMTDVAELAAALNALTVVAHDLRSARAAGFEAVDFLRDSRRARADELMSTLRRCNPTCGPTTERARGKKWTHAIQASSIPSDCPLLCTLAGCHDGPHEAGMTGGGVAATWMEPAPLGAWRDDEELTRSPNPATSAVR